MSTGMLSVTSQKTRSPPHIRNNTTTEAHTRNTKAIKYTIKHAKQILYYIPGKYLSSLEVIASKLYFQSTGAADPCQQHIQSRATTVAAIALYFIQPFVPEAKLVCFSRKLLVLQRELQRLLVTTHSTRDSQKHRSRLICVKVSRISVSPCV